MGSIYECIEQLAQKGCQSVLRDIKSLEAGVSLPETKGLNSIECRLVLRELRQVMQVYSQPCDAKE